MFFDMSDVIKIKKGLTIKLEGEAEKTISEFNPPCCAIKPTDFTGVFPKLLVQEGDKVLIGEEQWIVDFGKLIDDGMNWQVWMSRVTR